METTEQPQHRGGDIYNYFQGATINNLVINGNMTKSGSEQYDNREHQEEKRSLTPEQVKAALDLCGTYIWGNAAYSIAFCVCRDVYHAENNASLFERMLNEQGINIPIGTINTAMSRNAWMKYPVDSWEENGASKRAMKLRDIFIQHVETLLLPLAKAV
jgi:hypothetical protein